MVKASDGGYLASPVASHRQTLAQATGRRSSSRWASRRAGGRHVWPGAGAAERPIERRAASRRARDDRPNTGVGGRADRSAWATCAVLGVQPKLGNQRRPDGHGQDRVRVRLGDTERWTLSSDDGQHVFLPTRFSQILSINGEPPPPEEAGWEDSVLVTPEREVDPRPSTRMPPKTFRNVPLPHARSRRPGHDGAIPRHRRVTRRTWPRRVWPGVEGLSRPPFMLRFPCERGASYVCERPGA